MNSGKNSIAIMQPYFMPYLGYFQLLKAVDIFVLYDDVNFIKKGWINRNRILTYQGEYTFTVPLHNTSQNRKISEHILLNPKTFFKNLRKTLECNYKKAPYYEQGIGVFEKISSYQTSDITTLCESALQLCCSLLDIKSKIVRSSELDNNKKLKGTSKIIDIAKHFNASHYINLPGGSLLYNHQDFRNQGIDLKFLKMDESISYSQIIPGFVPNLSLLDILMNVPLHQIKNWIKQYELIE